MQNAFAVSTENKSFRLGLPALLLTAFALASPTRVANYDFRHFSDDDGMTISFSRSSPPLAALEDERLPVVKTEPALEMKVLPHATMIGAGSLAAWQRLQKYAWAFEKRHHHLTIVAQHRKQATPKKHSMVVVQKSRVPFSKRTVVFHAANAIDHKELAKLTKVSELTKLLKPVSMSEEPNTVPRQGIEAPITGRQVERSLPRGEEVPPTVIPEDHVDEMASRALAGDEEVSGPGVVAPPKPGTPQPIPLGPWKLSQVPATPPAPRGSTTAQNKNPAGTVGTQEVALAPEIKPVINNIDKPVVSTESTQVAQSPESTQPSVGSSRIVGQVELSGGLAVTGQTTQLSVVWKSGLETRQAMIDYSTGQFILDVPYIDAGKIIATVTDSSKRVLGESLYDLDGAAPPDQHLLEGLKLVIEPKETFVKGRVRSAYSVDDLYVAAKDAEVFGPNGTRVPVDPQGQFHLEGINSDSTLIEESYAPDHWGTSVLAEGGRKAEIPVFSTKMLQSFFDLIGQSNNNTELGVVWGEVKHHGKPQAGVQVQLASPQDAVGPFYFNALRIPDKSLTTTSGNGLYAFVKVKPGLQLVLANYSGNTLPSSVVSVSASMVSYTEIAFKSAVLKGVVQDPILQQTIPAQISVVGSLTTTTSSQKGFQMRVPSSDAVLFVEANAGPEYLVSREAVPRSKVSNLDIYSFKKDWLSNELQLGGLQQDKDKGVFIGYVKGPNFHVALDGTPGNEYSEQNIGYFGAEGHLEAGRIEGLGGGGGFVMTNLPPGLHTLVITSAEGEMTMTRLFVAEAGVVNVTNANLRP